MKQLRFVKGYRGELTNKRQMVPGDVWRWPDDVAAALIEMGVAVEVQVRPAVSPAQQAAQVVTPASVPRPEIPDVDDPGEHSVAVVAAYAGQHPDEIDRLATAETAGQNRVTLLRALEALRRK